MEQTIINEIIQLYKDGIMYKDMPEILLEKYGIQCSMGTCKYTVYKNTTYRNPVRNDYKIKITPEIKNFINNYNGTTKQLTKDILEKFNVSISHRTIAQVRPKRFTRNNKPIIYYSEEEKTWLTNNIPIHSHDWCVNEFEKIFGRRIQPRRFAENHNLNFLNEYDFTEDMIKYLEQNIALEQSLLIEEFKKYVDNTKTNLAIKHHIKKLKNKDNIYYLRAKWIIDNKHNYYNWKELTKDFNKKFGTNYHAKYFGERRNNRGPYYKYLINLRPFKRKTPVSTPPGTKIYEQYYNTKLTFNENIFYLDGNNKNRDISNLIKVTKSQYTYLVTHKYTNDLALAYINLSNLNRVLRGETL